MKIVTYVAGLDSPCPPDAHQALARILLADGFLPVLFRGPSEGAARAQAQTFWDAEMAKRSPKPIETRIGKLDPVEPAVASKAVTDGLEALFG